MYICIHTYMCVYIYIYVCLYSTSIMFGRRYGEAAHAPAGGGGGRGHRRHSGVHKGGCSGNRV